MRRAFLCYARAHVQDRFAIDDDSCCACRRTPRRAAAASINIVVLGASNTYGKGVARNAALPAQLQAMLRAKGYDVRVGNAGINGDTTAGMLRRLNAAVPAGTRLVILQPGNNDVRKGVGGDRAGNISSHHRKPAGARRQGDARGAYARRPAATLAAGWRTSHGGRISSRRRAHASASRGGYRRTLKLLSSSRRSS